jgi:hypothetical protein
MGSESIPFFPVSDKNQALFNFFFDPMIPITWLQKSVFHELDAKYLLPGVRIPVHIGKSLVISIVLITDRRQKTFSVFN